MRGRYSLVQPFTQASSPFSHTVQYVATDHPGQLTLLTYVATDHPGQLILLTYVATDHPGQLILLTYELLITQASSPSSNM
jgi:hypothetical protein